MALPPDHDRFIPAPPPGLLPDAAPDAGPDGAAAPHPSPATAPRVVLLGKPGCHLCDQARTVVEQVCAEVGEPWAERSTLEDIAFEMTYWEHIPVLFVDGVPRSRWVVDPDALRTALAR